MSRLRREASLYYLHERSVVVAPVLAFAPRFPRNSS